MQWRERLVAAAAAGASWSGGAASGSCAAVGSVLTRRIVSEPALARPDANGRPVGQSALGFDVAGKPC